MNHSFKIALAKATLGTAFFTMPAIAFAQSYPVLSATPDSEVSVWGLSSNLPDLTVTDAPTASAPNGGAAVAFAQGWQPQAGSAMALSVPITNLSSTTPVSGPFSNIWQMSTTSNVFAGYSEPYAAQTMTSMAAGASGTMSNNWTPPYGGTWYIRACANFNTSWATSTAESDYNNNCGPVASMTISNPPPPGSLTCVPSSQTVVSGSSAVWSASNGTPTYTWKDALGATLGTGSPFSKKYTNTSGGPEYYAVTVTDGTGATSPACNLTVMPGSSCSGSTSYTITANPTVVAKGKTSTLTWTTHNANSCTITGPGVNMPYNPACAATANSSTPTPALTATSKYCITCDGGAPVCTIIKVGGSFQEF